MHLIKFQTISYIALTILDYKLAIQDNNLTNGLYVAIWNNMTHLVEVIHDMLFGVTCNECLILKSFHMHMGISYSMHQVGDDC